MAPPNPDKFIEAMQPRTAYLAKLATFHRTSLVYKEVNGTPMDVGVLVSKKLAASPWSKPSPLLVHFHGGSLVLGCIFEPFFTSIWPLNLAAEQDAVMVSVSYRLFPEASGIDILDDVRDFWLWAHAELPARLAKQYPRLSLDMTRIAVTGESAGGFLTLVTGASFAREARHVRVLMAQYCGVGADNPVHYAHSRSGPMPEAVAQEIIEKYMAGLEPGAVRIASPFPEMMDVMAALAKTELSWDKLRADERLSLGKSIKKAESLAPVWIMQGDDDTLVTKGATDYLVKQIREAHPDTPLLYTEQPGEHGFDGNVPYDTPYIQEGIEFVKKYW